MNLVTTNKSQEQETSVLGRLLTPKPIMISMWVLQFAWLISINVTGVALSEFKVVQLMYYSTACLVAVLLLPKSWAAKIVRLREFVAKDERLIIALLVGGMLILGAVYANYQRMWPYDEEFSYQAAKIIADQGIGQFFAEYAQIPWLGRWHPPLAPLVRGLAMMAFGENLLVARLVTVLFAAGTVIVTYIIGRRWYDKRTGFVAGLLLISLPLFLRQSAAAMTDIQVTFFFTLAILLTTVLLEKPSLWLAIVTGVVIGAGMLTKYTMLLIGPVLVGYFLLNASWKRFGYMALAGIISLLMLAAWIGFAYQLGVLAAQAHIGEIYPAGAIINPSGRGWFFNSLFTKLPSAIGTYNIPLAIIGFVGLLKFRTRSDILVFLTIAVISILLILSVPDHRYFMLIFPMVGLMMSRGFKLVRGGSARILLLTGLYAVGAWYLFVDWHRVVELFGQ